MKPLANRRVLITRTRHQASDLAVQLEAHGAIPILIPTIEIIPPESYAPLDAALTHLDTCDWLLFTSVNAVEIFHQRLVSLQRTPSDQIHPTLSRLPRIAVIGPATARAVQSLGLVVDLIPPHYIAESLSAALTPYAAGAHMLLIRAAEARDHLPEALTMAGATVTIAIAYRNQIPPDSISALSHLLSVPTLYPDVITFTSASTATNLFTLLEAASFTLPPHITLASIGPVTSRMLRDLGHGPTVEAAAPTIPALIQSLIDHFSK